MSILKKYVNINYTTLHYIIILLILIRNTFKLKIKNFKVISKYSFVAEFESTSSSTKQLTIIYFFRLSKVNRRRLGRNMFL